MRPESVPSAWERSPRGLGIGLAVCTLLALVAAAAFVLTRPSTKVYGMSGDTRVTLPNGRAAPSNTLSVAEALAVQPKHPRLVHGYLLSPMDDAARLCSRLNEYADCRGAPRLLIANLSPDALFGGVIKGLKQGCCATGFWSPRPIALRGIVVGHTLYLIPTLV
jgi:hypothetical protein